MNNGYIVKDTPLHDFVEDCGDASTGSYWFSNGGCTAPSDSTHVAKITEKTYKDEEGKDITNESFGTENSAKQYDDRKLSAFAVLVIDFQISLYINDEDDEKKAYSSLYVFSVIFATCVESDGAVHPPLLNQ
ncbi:hypothetical protein EUA71_01735 [TM7 phylum sp. oral taxon 352]|nr:hypothetical protein EUA71_01735 [TM7 phylum sp. oral taxon 352]